MYFEVTGVDDDWLEGVCEDANNGINPDFPVHDGEVIHFKRHNVAEIPLDGPTNADLKARAISIQKG